MSNRYRIILHLLASLVALDVLRADSSIPGGDEVTSMLKGAMLPEGMPREKVELILGPPVSGMTGPSLDTERSKVSFYIVFCDGSRVLKTGVGASLKFDAYIWVQYIDGRLVGTGLTLPDTRSRQWLIFESTIELKESDDAARAKSLYAHALLFCEEMKQRMKAAEPGATDNPDGA